jgi:hypothetical protein
MLSAVILSCLLAGAGAACAAHYLPAYAAVLEKGAGMLIIAGLALLGVAVRP